jgi:ferritin-like metal-binding protein YciE
MSQTATSLLASALRNAQAMESKALELLAQQAGRLEQFPELHAQIHHHLGETERQLARLENCLDALGEEASFGLSQTPPHAANGPGGGPEEQPLADVFSTFAFENFEIAAYRSLLALCEAAVQRSIAPLLQESLKEEEAMAKWLKENIQRLTRDHVNNCERNVTTAKGENAMMKEIKPPRPDVGGQRGQGDERDHPEPAKRKPDRKAPARKPS